MGVWFAVPFSCDRGVLVIFLSHTWTPSGSTIQMVLLRKEILLLNGATKNCSTFFAIKKERGV